jgi:hypothetical protein
MTNLFYVDGIEPKPALARWLKALWVWFVAPEGEDIQAIDDDDDM